MRFCPECGRLYAVSSGHYCVQPSRRRRIARRVMWAYERACVVTATVVLLWLALAWVLRLWGVE